MKKLRLIAVLILTLALGMTCLLSLTYAEEKEPVYELQIENVEDGVYFSVNELNEAGELNDQFTFFENSFRSVEVSSYQFLRRECQLILSVIFTFDATGDSMYYTASCLYLLDRVDESVSDFTCMIYEVNDAPVLASTVEILEDGSAVWTNEMDGIQVSSKRFQISEKSLIEVSLTFDETDDEDLKEMTEESELSEERIEETSATESTESELSAAEDTMSEISEESFSEDADSEDADSEDSDLEDDDLEETSSAENETEASEAEETKVEVQRVEETDIETSESEPSVSIDESNDIG